MNARRARKIAPILPVATLAACTTYIPPSPPPPLPLSRDLPASYDRAWSAAMRVADTDFFETKTAEKANGRLTLRFRTRDPSAYVDCGGTANGSAGRPTPALQGLGFDSAFLEGTANVEISNAGRGAAAVRVDDQYTLGVYSIDPIGMRTRIAEFRFGSDSSDTRRVGLLLVTCRSSRSFERRLLDQLAAGI
jgi:hypothetical protein